MRKTFCGFAFCFKISLEPLLISPRNSCSFEKSAWTLRGIQVGGVLFYWATSGSRGLDPKIMQFSGNFKEKNPILSKFWAQDPPGVKTLLGPPDQNPGSATASYLHDTSTPQPSDMDAKYVSSLASHFIVSSWARHCDKASRAQATASHIVHMFICKGKSKGAIENQAYFNFPLF